MHHTKNHDVSEDTELVTIYILKDPQQAPKWDIIKIQRLKETKIAITSCELLITEPDAI